MGAKDVPQPEPRAHDVVRNRGEVGTTGSREVDVADDGHVAREFRLRLDQLVDRPPTSLSPLGLDFREYRVLRPLLEICRSASSCVPSGARRSGRRGQRSV